MTNDGGEAAQTALAECNYQGLKCYQPQSYGLSNNAGPCSMRYFSPQHTLVLWKGKSFKGDRLYGWKMNWAE